MKRLTPERRREIRALLKAAYDAVLAEDHSAFHHQVRKLQ